MTDWRPPLPFLRDARAPAGLRLYAVGDVHGRLDLLRDLHARIAADLVRRPTQAFRIIHLGDYVDRGPDSAGVIAHLVEFCRDGDAVCLGGNHDAMVRDFLRKPASCGEQWLANGGDETLASYGVPTPPGATLKTLRKALEDAMPPEHRAFFESLPLTERHGDYLFVHAGVRPGVAMKKQKEQDLLWIRDPFLTSAADHGAVVVHGHTITPEPVVRPNRVGIDTKAWATGRLTCLTLEDDRKGFLTPDGYADIPVEAMAA
jgi:serine/threonine protein phosphatase 1